MKSQAEINWGRLSNYLDADSANEGRKTETQKPAAPTRVQSSALKMPKKPIPLTGSEMAILKDSIPVQTTSQIVSAPADGPSLKAFQNATGLLSNAWDWFRARQGARSNTKRLEVATTVSLGEKRFVAVIKIDGQQFLVGGGATNVALLAQLNSSETFSDLLKDTMIVPADQPALEQRKKSAKVSLKRAGAQA